MLRSFTIVRCISFCVFKSGDIQVHFLFALAQKNLFAFFRLLALANYTNSSALLFLFSNTYFPTFLLQLFCFFFFFAADGYARSEAIAVLFLQKKKDARRMYAKLIHVKINNDGWKSEGQHCPSMKMQAALFDSFYKECQISPNSVDYLEFHGTGTKVKETLEISIIVGALMQAGQYSKWGQVSIVPPTYLR